MKTRLEEQRQEHERDDRPARDEGQDGRPHQQVERRDEEHRDQAAAELVDPSEAGQQPGRDVERDDAGDERDDARA